MRRLLAVIAVLANLLTYSNASATAQIKPKIGIACSKINSTYKVEQQKLICTKKNGNLLWVVQKPNPQTTSTAPVSTNSSDFTKNLNQEWGECAPVTSGQVGWVIGLAADGKTLSYLQCQQVKTSPVQYKNEWVVPTGSALINQNTKEPISGSGILPQNQSTTPPAPSPSPTPTPILTYPDGSGNPNPPIYPETDASRAIQKIIDSAELSNSTNKTDIETIIEPGGINGPYVSIAEEGTRAALNFYSSIGLNIPAAKITLVLGRSHDWSADTLNTLAPNALPADFPLTGGFTLTCCNVIYTNLVTGTIHSGNPPVDIDLSHVIETSDWAADFAHETFHVFQSSYPTNLHTDFPIWMSEGSAQLFGYMTAVKMSDGKITYNQEIEKYLDWQHDAQPMCSGPIAQMQSPCDYTQGMFVVEYFVSKYGISGLEKLLHHSDGPTFQQQFMSATGDSLEDFYKSADAELEERGWEK
jgi:hypothetical protein